MLYNLINKIYWVKIGMNCENMSKTTVNMLSKAKPLLYIYNK